MEKKITIYSTKKCTQCKMAKRLLEGKGVPFVEIDIEENPEFAEKLRGDGFRSLPVIVADNHAFSGFKIEEIRELIKQYEQREIA